MASDEVFVGGKPANPAGISFRFTISSENHPLVANGESYASYPFRLNLTGEAVDDSQGWEQLLSTKVMCVIGENQAM